MELKLFELKCQRCGGELKTGEKGVYTCKSCGKSWQSDVLSGYDAVLRSAEDALNNKIIELVANQRRLLWKEVNKLNVSNARVEECCKEIIRYVPDDFYANFFLATCSKYDGALAEFFRPIDLRNVSQDDIIFMAEYLTKRVKEEWILIADNLISAIKDSKKYNAVREQFNRKKLDFDNCVFNPDYHRNVFVCYASDDMAIVTEVVSALEREGVKCFVAARNLQHGSGAVEEYNRDIHRAIKNCDMILFFSSSHSRDLYRDTYTEEISYIKENIDGSRPGYRMPRLEYIITRYQDTRRASDDNFKEFFDGKERCETNDVSEVVRRVHKILGGLKSEPAPEAVSAPKIQREEKKTPPKRLALTPEQFTEGKKLCSKCGTAVDPQIKCCVNCGSNAFFESYGDYYLTTVKYCAKCGRANTENYNCCPECGSSDFVDYEKHLKLQKAKAKEPLGKKIGNSFTAAVRAMKGRPVITWAVIWELLFIAALIISIVTYVNTKNPYALGCIIGSSVIIAYTIYTVIVYNLCKSGIESRQKFGRNFSVVFEMAFSFVMFITCYILIYSSKQNAICFLFIYVGFIVSEFCELFVLRGTDNNKVRVTPVILSVFCIGASLLLLGYTYGF